MADFTAVQSGNWNDGATWGNTSPGVAGTDYPGVDADTATIAYTVTYDVGDSTVYFGNVTINSGGILTFPTSANSTLNFNDTGILTVNSGGELRLGTSSTPIDAAYHCYIYWAQGTATRYTLVCNDGGIINTYGDAGFYGSIKYAYLDSDWTTGQSFYVTGDLSGWQAGQKFYIHENIQYNNYQNDGHIYTISSVGSYDSVNDRTQITISETAPEITFTAVHATTGHVSKLIMISRNVELADPACPLTVYGYSSYTERLRFDNNQGANNTNIQFNEVMMYGWESAVYGGYNFRAENIVFVSNLFAVNNGTNYRVSGDAISNYRGILYGGNHCQITGDTVSCYYGVSYGINHLITGDFVSNFIGLSYGINHQIIGDFISNYRVVAYGTNHHVIGNFLSNSTMFYSGLNYQATGNFDNTTNIYGTSATSQYRTVLEDCTISGTDRRALRIYGNSGNFLNLISGDLNFQEPPSSNGWIFEAIPNSYCSDSFVGKMYLAYHNNPMPGYVNSGSQTLTFKIYPIGWTTTLDQDDIILEVKYPDTASGITRSTVYNTTNTYANDTWGDLSATFTAAQDGVIYINIMITRYESGASILIDPVWSII